MQKILVPTDFSQNALKALTYAAEIAQKSGATILLLNVIEPSINMARMQLDSSREEVVKERSTSLLQLQRTVAAIFSDVNVIIHIKGGKPIEAIPNYAEEENVDLIVMGTTGASGFKEFFMGSVTAGIFGKTKIPVLSIPISYEVEEPDAILFATNQFEKNKIILDQIVSISKLFSAAIHVVVFKDMNGDENADLIYNEEQLNGYLRFLKETYPNVIFKGEILKGHDFEITIDSYCNSNEVDIIAMVSYPKSFLEKVLRKSVTQKMAFHSTIPILAIPAIIQHK